MGAPAADVPRPAGRPAPSGPTSMSSAAISAGVAARPMPKVGGCLVGAFAGCACACAAVTSSAVIATTQRTRTKLATTEDTEDAEEKPLPSLRVPRVLRGRAFISGLIPMAPVYKEQSHPVEPASQ